MHDPIKVAVIGAGNMGSSHARAYAANPGFDLVAIIDQSQEKRQKLSNELGGIDHFDSLNKAIATHSPGALAVCTYPDSHFNFVLKGLESGMHIFVEKPIAETVAQSIEISEKARDVNKKIVVGYILRHHPAWQKFTELAQTLGKPLAMRMNLNQQSSGKEWETHKNLLSSMSPIVDCGVHYVDIMCMMTRSKPLRVQAMGARLSDEIAPEMYNYGQLQVIFEDGSVGWYEAAWGPMISETAFFVKDVMGPKGCVSIKDPAVTQDVDSSDIDSHTKTNSLLVHYSEVDEKGHFVKKDQLIDTSDEPDHQELCNREQAYFLKAIKEDLDLTDHLNDAVNSLKIVLAADESVRTGRVVKLS
jgi:predicted dehydrogenase